MDGCFTGYKGELIGKVFVDVGSDRGAICFLRNVSYTAVLVYPVSTAIPLLPVTESF